MWLYQRLAFAALVGLVVGGVVARFTVGLLLHGDAIGYVTVPAGAIGALSAVVIVWARNPRQ